MTEFDQDLYQMITRTRQVIIKARKTELRKYGVPAVYVAAMNAIVRLKKRATPANISKALFLEPHSVSELLSKMEELGLIRRLKDLERKNYVRAELTEAGYEKFRDSLKIESIKDMMSVLSPEEKKQLWRLLSRIRSQALSQLGLDDENIYPPSKPSE
jgi:DNA-binding MarR family transcriptional regulator